MSAGTFDALDLRGALGRFGTGVTIVTTVSREGVPVGVTANSFNSVSLDPPIVLWSLRTRSPSLAAFDEAGRFVVNVLAREQLALSRRFASSQADKFSGVAFEAGLGGLPVLGGCAAVFQCRTEQRLEVGDHILFLGRVEAYEHRPGPTLLYCHGRYAEAAALDPEPSPMP